MIMIKSTVRTGGTKSIIRSLDVNVRDGHLD